MYLIGSDSRVLRSDADEQLLIHIPFKTKVKLQTLEIVCPQDDSSAHRILLFVNLPSMTFSDTSVNEPKQVITIPKGGGKIALKFVNFQRVDHLTLFVEGE